MTREQTDLLAASVQRKLAGRVSDLRLMRTKQGLVLKGLAHSYYAKQLAQQAVMTATGLSLLANDIEVLPPALTRGNQS
jgi:hypothetical protein